jgi:carbonic anhydrase
VDQAYHGVSAALEFAVTQLQVEELVVMGHGACGGCAAALTGQFAGAQSGAGHFISHWVGMLDEARERVRRKHPELSPEAFRTMEHEGVRISLRNLMTFPWVRERVDAGTLRLHGAYFAIADGVLHVLDSESGTFSPA